MILSALDLLNQMTRDSVRCSDLVCARLMDPVLMTTARPEWCLHFTERKLRPTGAGPPLCSFLPAPVHPLFGKCRLWEARRDCNLEITLAGVWAQAAGPAGGQLIIRIPL